ncbi:MAG TPA: hypothetical protein VLX59_09925, partial [Acidimicrobiales bacterium]|nr:hypothetical protein [Acidimicrobiales bacterium]
MLGKHGRVGRFGEFYDQDDDSARPGVWAGPVHAGHGMLYDQDATVETPRRDRAAELRRREAEDRQRDREIELRRERDLARERDARRQRAREASQHEAPGPVRISSRPGATSSRMPPASPPPGRSAPRVRISTTGDVAPAPARPGRDRGGAPTTDGATAGDVVQPGGGRSRPQSTQEATAVVAVGTFASRLTGFIRVLAIGY